MKSLGWILSIMFCVPLLSHAQNESKFTLEGKLENISGKPEKVLLYYPYREQNFMDSADVRDGKYHFDGLLSGPVRADLYLKYKKDTTNMGKDVMSIFIQPGDITVNSLNTFSNVTVTGSPSNEDFKLIQAAAVPFEAKMAPLMEQYNAYAKDKNRSGQNQVAKQILALRQQMNDNMYGNFVRSNPNSVIALYALQQYAGINIKNPDEIQKLLLTLPANEQNSTDGQKLNQLIKLAKLAPIGGVAPDFIQNDTLGNPVALSSFRGHYTLLSFWASWCGPCRSDNKLIVYNYNKYKAKGFKILGVSLDKPGDKDDWIDAIHQDKLDWTQVSDLQFWNNAAAKKFGVVALPQNFLIDPSGKIVAKDVRGADLEDLLAKYYPGN